MAKNDTKQEYSWDSGTYQTGATKEDKRQSGVITALLIAAIFLGGLASALGLMNIRLLSQLMEEPQEPVLPVSVDSTQGSQESFFSANREQSPQVPKNRKLEIVSGTTSNLLPAEAPTMGDVPGLLTMTVKSRQGQLTVGPALALSQDGFLLTNAHLLEQGGSITVQMQDGQSFPAVLVAVDAYSDLAVLYIQTQELIPVTFADGSLPMASLHALVDGESLSAGEVGDKTYTLAVGAETLNLVQTNFATDHGPVFNGFGQLQGFLCRYFGREDRGMMLSAAQVMAIAEELVEKGSVSGRPGLGLQTMNLSAFSRQYWNLSHGLEITDLEENGGAKAAGLLEGDILLAVNGAPLHNQHGLYAALLSARQGESLTLEVFRAGHRFTVTVPVAQEP